MATTKVQIQLQFNGPTPIVTNHKRLTLRNFIRIMWGIMHGTQFRPSGASSITVQGSLVAASATATPASVQAGDTLSIGGTALTATQKRASGTVTAASVLANDTVTINGSVFTAVNGSPVAQQFDMSGTNTQCAASLVTAVLASVDPKVAGLISAKSTAAVATIFSVAQGTTGNGYTLASSNGGRLAVSGATLANGAAATNNAFDFVGTDAQTGAAIRDAVNNSTSANITQTSATAASNGVVTVTAKVLGTAGNAVTFTSSNGGRLAVTGAGFLASGSGGAPIFWTL